MRRVYRRPKPNITDEKKFWVNNQIRIPEVFLIDEDGNNVGVVSTARALAMAQEAGADLVEVNPKANPPVAKIMDFGQFKYKKDKEAQKQKSKQKKAELKGVRLSVRISQHDFDFRVDQARKFLSKGNKLKIELILKGREKGHPERASEVINRFVETIKQDDSLNIEIEQALTKQGGRFNIVLVNKQ
jgi:translation initiation factor IF-3